MSPIMMALLGLVAYNAFKGSGSQPGGQRPDPLPTEPTGSVGHSGGGIRDILGGLLGGKPDVAPAGGRPSGSLKELLPGGLGGLLAGASAGTVLSGGLGNLTKDLEDSGYGRKVQSWIGTGPNQAIAPNELASALGSDTIDELSQKTGVEREQLLDGLSRHLPELINQLTPNGRLPTAQELSRMI